MKASLRLSGDFFEQNRYEIMSLVFRFVEQQKTEHPMKCILGIEDANNDGVLITFTDIHLLRGVGEAIKHAHKGEFTIQSSESTDVIHATWVRQ